MFSEYYERFVHDAGLKQGAGDPVELDQDDGMANDSQNNLEYEIMTLQPRFPPRIGAETVVSFVNTRGWFARFGTVWVLLSPNTKCVQNIFDNRLPIL